MSLPTTKTSPTLDVASAKILLYGEPGVGKTTLAADIDPDKTLILASEPGTGGIEAFVQQVGSWEQFREVGAELAKGKHDFTTVAVDTADELFRMCQDHVMKEHGVKHPSDLDYGKGWTLLGDEWRLRVGKLAALGLGVLFTSHSKDEEVKQRVGTRTVTRPSLTGQGGKFLEGFVDYILLAQIEHAEDGEKRVLRTAPSENWVAKSRIALPDPLPLDGAALREAMAGASKAATA